MRLPIAMVQVSPELTVLPSDGVPLNTTRFCVVAVLSWISLSAHVCAGAFVIVIAGLTDLRVDGARLLRWPIGR